jgi:hypothetical protein
MMRLVGLTPRRWLFAWFAKIATAAIVGLLVTFGAFAQDTADGIRVMQREKSLAEQLLVLLNNFGPKDTGQYAKGIILYAEARADFDGLITELEYELEQGQPPNKSEKFESALKDAVAKRVAFTSFVTDTLVPRSDAAQKGMVGDFIKGSGDLIKALTDSGLAIWHEFQSGGDARRKEIRQELESLRWPQFSAPGGKSG